MTRDPVLGLRICVEGGMPKIAIGITGLSKILGQGYRIKEPIGDPYTQAKIEIVTGRCV